VADDRKSRSRATIEAYRRDLTKLLESMKDAARNSTTFANVTSSATAISCVAKSAPRLDRTNGRVDSWMVRVPRGGGYLASDPVSIEGWSTRPFTAKPLAEDEVTALLDSIPDATPSDLRDRALLELLYGTGARVSEVVGIGLGTSISMSN